MSAAAPISLKEALLVSTPFFKLSAASDVHREKLSWIVFVSVILCLWICMAWPGTSFAT